MNFPTSTFPLVGLASLAGGSPRAWPALGWDVGLWRAWESVPSEHLIGNMVATTLTFGYAN